jgi:hypothetical protein
MDPIEREKINVAINSLIAKHGDQLPDPEHYPRIVSAMIRHELFEIERKRYEQENQKAG